MFDVQILGGRYIIRRDGRVVGTARPVSEKSWFVRLFALEGTLRFFFENRSVKNEFRRFVAEWWNSQSACEARDAWEGIVLAYAGNPNPGASLKSDAWVRAMAGRI